MKKILSILIALVTFAGIADAQISIKKSDIGKGKQVATLAMSWSWIYQDGDGYFLDMKSDNQYDDHFLLHLGKTKDECVESLNSLLELANTIGETDRFNIDNGAGEVFDVTQYKAIGMKGLRFHGEGYAGTSYLTPNNLNKALKWIQKNVK